MALRNYGRTLAINTINIVLEVVTEILQWIVAVLTMTPWNWDLHLVKYKTCTIHWYDSRLCVCASVVVIVDTLIFYF